MDEKDPNAVPPAADATILRPRPGAGRRPAPTLAPIATAPGPTGHGLTPRGPAPELDPGAPAGPPERLVAFDELTLSGRNPILQAAAPLLTLAVRLQSAARQGDVPALRREAAREMRMFRQRLGVAGVREEDANVASYVVCTFVDAMVLNTPWGAQSGWSAQSLLAEFHHETVGGAKFFQILDHLRTNPARYFDLIELMGVCLAFGFEGKYRVEERSHARLAELQDEVFGLIRDYRPRRHDELSPRWRGAERTGNPVLRFVPWWVVAAGGLLVLIASFIWFQTRLGAQAALIKSALAQPAARLEYAAALPSAGNRLRELLEAQVRAGAVNVEDLGEKTVITLTAADLFRSGSARVNPAEYATLREVALALNAVPGRVLIVGHTDDQPIRSLRFADNFELSRERALAVAEVLKPVIDDFARIEWSGLGASQPRYLPPDTPENRARNRRVELIHLGARASNRPLAGGRPEGAP